MVLLGDISIKMICDVILFHSLIFQLNNQKTEFYIYKFNEEPPSERYWDISECFDQHNESRSYELILKADIDKYQLDQNVGMMEYWTMAALEAFSGVRALRVNHVEVWLNITATSVQRSELEFDLS